MARQNTLGSKGTLNGYRVSHSHRRTKHLWMPNIQTKNLFSTVLNRTVKVTLAAQTLRTVDHAGGLDSYLLAAKPEELTTAMRRLRSQIQERSAAA